MYDYLQHYFNVSDCKSIDATCQNSMDRIGVTWTHFSDPETGIVSYYLAVGTSPGGGQIKPFFGVPVTVNYYLITGLSLKGKEKVSECNFFWCLLGPKVFVFLVYEPDHPGFSNKN
jgi:hypothetical protein